jgi:hypothetical protein
MITFKTKPITISPEYRLMYRIGQIVLILGKASIKQTASLLKLHYFSWAMRSPTNMMSAISFSEAKVSDFDFPSIWSIEPSLNRALAFAKAEKIIEISDGKIILSNRGKLLLSAIINDPEIFIDEKDFLSKVKSKISDAKLQRLSKWWENQYA